MPGGPVVLGPYHHRDTKLHGIKALRECGDAVLRNCDIISPEFGWNSHRVTIEDCTAQSEYFMMRGTELHFRNVTFHGKYSFQYIENSLFEHCSFDTKDAFWHREKRGGAQLHREGGVPGLVLRERDL